MKSKTTPGTLYTCIDCEQDVVLSPPLSQRTGANGPMTRAEALSIFRDGCGGRCTDCYLAHQRRETSALMERIGCEDEADRRARTLYSCDRFGNRLETVSKT